MPRRVAQYCGSVSVQGFQLKLYLLAISREGLTFPEGLREHALSLAASYLASDPPALRRWPAAGFGTLMVHLGADGVYVLLDLWAGSNMLVHQTWVAPLDWTQGFENVSPSGMTVCVFELAVQNFEALAWRNHMIHPDRAPAPELYLATGLNGPL